MNTKQPSTSDCYEAKVPFTYDGNHRIMSPFSKELPTNAKKIKGDGIKSIYSTCLTCCQLEAFMTRNNIHNYCYHLCMINLTR